MTEAGFEAGWLDGCAQIARAAGETIMSVYATDFTVRGKACPVLLLRQVGCHCYGATLPE